MRNISKFIVIGVLLAVVMLVAPVSAQEGEGGIIFVPNSAGDPATLNPLLAGDVPSLTVITRVYPDVMAVNPFTGQYEAGYRDSLATGWEFDDTGMVFTVHLREDAYWSDGVQITSADWIWALDALRSGLLNSDLGAFMFETLDDGTPGSGTVVDAVALDDFTVQITFAAPDCNNLGYIVDYVVPAHIFDADFGDDISLMNDDTLYLPGAYWGPWMDPELIPGDRVNLLANQEWPDSELGYVSPSEWVNLALPDFDTELERLRAGELTIYDNMAGYAMEEFENNPAWQVYTYTSLSWTYFAFNMADPANPQSGYEGGEYVEQAPHPILGDKLVRQGLSYAMNVDAVIETYKAGRSIHIGIPTIPAYPDWDPNMLRGYDPVMAAQLLDQAGWVMEDGKEWRVCRGCLYAQTHPEYEGTEMALTYTTYSGMGENFENYMTFLAQNMRDVGVNVTVEFIDFSSAFLPKIQGQTFDMAFGGWQLGIPADMDKIDLFGIEADIVGSGNNHSSYHNAELDQLYMDARNPELTDGCTVEGRLPYYQRANEILFEDVPNNFMWTNIGYTVAPSWLENWVPAPFDAAQNEDAWVAIPTE